LTFLKSRSNLIQTLYTLGEKLVIFKKFKRGDPSDLRPQDDRKRLNDKHQKNGNAICHSEGSEESHIVLLKIEFLTKQLNSNTLGEKLMIFIEFKNEILRTCVLRMTKRT